MGTMNGMIAAIFPGQGSQKPGMGQELYDAFPVAQEVFATVSQAIELDVANLCFHSDEETLRATNNAQIALFTCGVAAYRCLESQGISADLFAGHSIGEYAALVASGTLDLADGAHLVKRRGDLMASAGELAPGTMAAVLGLEIEAIRAVLSSVDGVVVVANDNCPGQVVISGSVAAVAAATPHLQEAGAKRVLPLNVSGAFHSPLMQGPSEEMAKSLAKVTFTEGKPVYSNVTTYRVAEATEWASLLERQLRESVHWTGSVQNMIAAGATRFIECGVGEVLTGMLKRIDKSVTGEAVYDSASLERAKTA